MLRLLPFLVIGIVAEHLSLLHADDVAAHTQGILPLGFPALGFTILILLLLAVLLRRQQRVAGVLVFAAVTFLGMLVMERSSRSLHYSQATHRYYDRAERRGKVRAIEDGVRAGLNGGGYFTGCDQREETPHARL